MSLCPRDERSMITRVPTRCQLRIVVSEDQCCVEWLFDIVLVIQIVCGILQSESISDTMSGLHIGNVVVESAV